MHSTLRLTTFFVSGIILGIVLTFVGLYVSFRTGAADAMLRAYALNSQPWPDVTQQIQQAGFTKEQQQQAEAGLNTTVQFGVPQGYATQSYADAAAGIVQDLQRLASTTEQLNPLLQRMNAQSLSGNFNGFFDLVFQAKSLVAQQRAITTLLVQHTSALAVANVSTPDATTKSQTQAVLAAAAPLQTDLQTYNDELDQLLSGAVPSTTLIQSIATTGQKLAQDSKAFGDALQPLLQHFAAAKPTK